MKWTWGLGSGRRAGKPDAEEGRHDDAVSFSRLAGEGKNNYFTLAPTTLSQSPVMVSFDLFCCSSVGNTAFA